MLSPRAIELQDYYLELCEKADEEPQPALLDLIQSHGQKPGVTKRLALLEHLGEQVNQVRGVLHKHGLLTVLDALREAGFEDQRILRSEDWTWQDGP